MGQLKFNRLLFDSRLTLHYRATTHNSRVANVNLNRPLLGNRCIRYRQFKSEICLIRQQKYTRLSLDSRLPWYHQLPIHYTRQGGVTWELPIVGQPIYLLSAMCLPKKPDRATKIWSIIVGYPTYIILLAHHSLYLAENRTILVDHRWSTDIFVICDVPTKQM